MYVCMHLCTYVCMHACMYVCISVLVYYVYVRSKYTMSLLQIVSRPGTRKTAHRKGIGIPAATAKRD